MGKRIRLGINDNNAGVYDIAKKKDTASHTHIFGSRRVRESIGTVSILEFDTNAKIMKKTLK